MTLDPTVDWSASVSLENRLAAETGTSVPLHQRAGGSADNIIQTYTPATKPQLQTLRGQCKEAGVCA